MDRYQQQTQENSHMATIAARTHAKNVEFASRIGINRGYHFNPKELSEEDKLFIFNAVVDIGMDAFVQNANAQFGEDIYAHLFDADHLLVIRSDGQFHRWRDNTLGAPRPIGFRMYNTYETPMGKALYLAGMCIKPGWQGKGIGQKLTRYAIEHERPDFVFTITQNPVAKLSMDRAVGKESYPRVEGGQAPNDLIKLIAGLRSVTPEKGMCLPQHYGRTLYGTLPVSYNEQYNGLFGKLNRRNGDAYLCIVETAGGH